MNCFHCVLWMRGPPLSYCLQRPSAANAVDGWNICAKRAFNTADGARDAANDHVMRQRNTTMALPQKFAAATLLHWASHSKGLLEDRLRTCPSHEPLLHSTSTPRRKGMEEEKGRYELAPSFDSRIHDAVRASVQMHFFCVCPFPASPRLMVRASFRASGTGDNKPITVSRGKTPQSVSRPRRTLPDNASVQHPP